MLQPFLTSGCFLDLWVFRLLTYYLQINSQHETLQRKWSDLKRQFD